jgi:hypothetical protein
MKAPLNLSHRRSLLGDLSEGLRQQMYFWGCDARYEGNLLVRCGMERVAREKAEGEGSSRYRQDWAAGVVELHSYCAGWYPREERRAGVVFIRSKERVQSCTGGTALTPGVYEAARMGAEGRDELLERVKPLVAWVLVHEEAVLARVGEDFRERCWEEFRRRTRFKAWLRPAEGRRWLRQFLDEPLWLERAGRGG